jgi:hypothetical protein
MNAVAAAKPQQTFGARKTVTDICVLVDDIAHRKLPERTGSFQEARGGR